MRVDQGLGFWVRVYRLFVNSIRHNLPSPKRPLNLKRDPVKLTGLVTTTVYMEFHASLTQGTHPSELLSVMQFRILCSDHVLATV